MAVMTAVVFRVLVAVVAEAVGMRPAVPAAGAATAGVTSAQARQGLRDGLGLVILCSAHASILHAS